MIHPIRLFNPIMNKIAGSVSPDVTKNGTLQKEVLDTDPICLICTNSIPSQNGTLHAFGHIEEKTPSSWAHLVCPPCHEEIFKTDFANTCPQCPTNSCLREKVIINQNTRAFTSEPMMEEKLKVEERQIEEVVTKYNALRRSWSAQTKELVSTQLIKTAEKYLPSPLNLPNYENVFQTVKHLHHCNKIDTEYKLENGTATIHSKDYDRVLLKAKVIDNLCSGAINGSWIILRSFLVYTNALENTHKTFSSLVLSKAISGALYGGFHTFYSQNPAAEAKKQLSTRSIEMLSYATGFALPIACVHIACHLYTKTRSS